MICLFVLWRIFAVRSDLQPADGRCQKKTTDCRHSPLFLITYRYTRRPYTDYDSRN
ncbi:hypothetical protein HMPREF1039_0697 [Megasphaera lornae]|uniref:Uncharacterized protein n=1 Tax=Megasphaera lornae TaxID=1000568 RepID=D3LWR2_9FIRM|nr:hypothetical protein HMPREF0889_0719 [Megasphaera genomosp. type_1 str. 28L]EGL40266.1 hypothetical protein HMPREF1039_0697 [Megasphaera lornae]